MRIIQITNSFSTRLGGAERIARALHLGMLEQQIDAHIISLEPSDLKNLSSSHSLDLSNIRAPHALIRLEQKLRGLVNDETVVHAHLFPTTLWVSTLWQAGRFDAPLAMTEHSTDNRRRRTWAGRMLDRGIYRGIDRIAAISSGAKDALTASYPALMPKVEIVENGTMLRHDALPPRRGNSRPNNAAPTQLISVGRLKDAKNLENLLAALARITECKWHYTIVGDGPLRAKLERMTREHKIADRVTFTGQVSDPYPLLDQADIFLMPSRWEGFGLAAVEAMNAGLPCVVSNVPGLRDVVGDGAPPSVAPDDVAGLAATIAGLIADPDRCAQLGRAGFARSLSFGQDRMVAQYLAFWQALRQELPG